MPNRDGGEHTEHDDSRKVSKGHHARRRKEKKDIEDFTDKQLMAMSDSEFDDRFALDDSGINDWDMEGLDAQLRERP